MRLRSFMIMSPILRGGRRRTRTASSPGALWREMYRVGKPPAATTSAFISLLRERGEFGSWRKKDYGRINVAGSADLGWTRTGRDRPGNASARARSFPNVVMKTVEGRRFISCRLDRPRECVGAA